MPDAVNRPPGSLPIETIPLFALFDLTEATSNEAPGVWGAIQNSMIARSSFIQTFLLEAECLVKLQLSGLIQLETAYCSHHVFAFDPLLNLLLIIPCSGVSQTPSRWVFASPAVERRNMADERYQHRVVHRVLLVEIPRRYCR